jgi:hypothetical protein
LALQEMLAVKAQRREATAISRLTNDPCLAWS